MSEFTAEGLSVLLTVISFGILMTIFFWVIPQFTDIMIQVVESSVL